MLTVALWIYLVLLIPFAVVGTISSIQDKDEPWVVAAPCDRQCDAHLAQSPTRRAQLARGGQSDMITVPMSSGGDPCELSTARLRHDPSPRLHRRGTVA